MYTYLPLPLLLHHIYVRSSEWRTVDVRLGSTQMCMLADLIRVLHVWFSVKQPSYFRNSHKKEGTIILTYMYMYVLISYLLCNLLPKLLLGFSCQSGRKLPEHQVSLSITPLHHSTRMSNSWLLKLRALWRLGLLVASMFSIRILCTQTT